MFGYGNYWNIPSNLHTKILLNIRLNIKLSFKALFLKIAELGTWSWFYFATTTKRPIVREPQWRAKMRKRPRCLNGVAVFIACPLLENIPLTSVIIQDLAFPTTVQFILLFSPPASECDLERKACLAGTEEPTLVHQVGELQPILIGWHAWQEQRSRHLSTR